MLTTIDCVLTIAQAVQLEVSTVLLGHDEGYIRHQSAGKGIHFTQCHGSYPGVGIQEGDCLQCSIGLALTGHRNRILIGLPASGILSGEFGVLHLILRRQSNLRIIELVIFFPYSIVTVLVNSHIPSIGIGCRIIVGVFV